MSALGALELDDLDRVSHSFIARRFAQLVFRPGASPSVVRFLQAKVQVERGEAREIGRTVRFGSPIVVFLREATGAYFWLPDPQFDARETAIVAELVRMLAG